MGFMLDGCFIGFCGLGHFFNGLGDGFCAASRTGYFRTKILPITVGSLKSVPLGESM
jgi:hypothetical protein